MKRKTTWSDDQLISEVKNNHSISGVIKSLGLKPSGSNYRLIKERISKLNLDTSHFTNKRSTINNTKRNKLDDILVENSSYTNTNSLKKRLLSEGFKEYKCENCNRSEWEGYPIPLELHHINGIHSDLRVENLKLLCPNCHALTENYRGKGIKKKESNHIKSIRKEYKQDKNQKFCSRECLYKYNRENSTKWSSNTLPIPKDELLDKIIEFNGNYSKIGEYYKIDRGTVRKYIKIYKLEKKVEEIRNQSKKKH